MRNLASQKEQQASVQNDSVYDKLRIFNSQSSGWAWYPGAAAPSTHLPLPTAATAAAAATQLNSQLAREDVAKRGKMNVAAAGKEVISTSFCAIFIFFLFPSMMVAAAKCFRLVKNILVRLRTLKSSLHWLQSRSTGSICKMFYLYTIGEQAKPYVK